LLTPSNVGFCLLRGIGQHAAELLRLLRVVLHLLLGIAGLNLEILFEIPGPGEVGGKIEARVDVTFCSA
jgi:hypothetical protein